MIDLDKVNLSSVPDYNFSGEICGRCVDSYFLNNKPHPVIKGFDSRLESIGFKPVSIPHIKRVWTWRNTTGDELLVKGGCYCLALKFNNFTTNIVFYPSDVAFMLLKHIEEFKMDVLRAIRIAELNQRIQEAQNDRSK